MSRTLVKAVIKDGTKIKSERRAEKKTIAVDMRVHAQSPNTELSFRCHALVLKLLVIRPSGQQVSGTSPSEDE